MRKTILYAAIFALMAAPFGLNTDAQQTGLQLQTKGNKVDPIRVAPIMGWVDGQPIVGKWVPYRQGEGGGGFPSGVLFDSFEGDTHFGLADICDADPLTNTPANGPLSGGVSPACDFGAGLTGACADASTRWFQGFTPGTNEPAWAGVIGALGSFADNAPCVATALSFSWSQSFGTDSPPPCGTYVKTYVIVNVYDNSVASQIDGVEELDSTELAAGFIDGLILDFGPLASSTAGYAFANIDLTGADPELHIGIVGGAQVDLPENGGLEVLFWDDDGADNPIPGSYAQPMLWAPKDSALQGAWATARFYFDGFFDFDNNLHTCLDYDGEYLITAQDYIELLDDPTLWPGGCPSILAPSIGLYGVPPVQVTSDAVDTGAFGNIGSGGLPEIAASDDTYMVFDPQFSTFRYQLQIVVDATSSTDTPSKIDFNYESNTFNVVGTVEQKVELFNYNTASFDTVDTRNTEGTDSVVSVRVTGNASDYVQAGTGAMQARIVYQNSFPFWVFNFFNLYTPYQVNVDHVFWAITP